MAGGAALSGMAGGDGQKSAQAAGDGAHKMKTQAQFEVFASRVKRAEAIRNDIANAAAPILNAIFQNGLGSSFDDAVELFDKLQCALDKYYKNIAEAATKWASQALAMTKTLNQLKFCSNGPGY
ncbi:hypothetical protein OsJ_28552 [Oryza sativa Japonica Group]|uniref:Uncharacterized protein n=1 Tax=Oryza sativa subsp. japonica TaxID=39947 RepID=B9G2D6_ORYSJ|nr:hypothetical protein OsJ_28552 [Oryza sativa Japonica Group]